MQRLYHDFIERKIKEYGNRFDASDLAPQFVKYFENQARIEVELSYGSERGRVGVSTGWKPVFLLIHRRTDRGSSTLLRKEDKVKRIIKRG